MSPDLHDTLRNKSFASNLTTISSHRIRPAQEPHRRAKVLSVFWNFSKDGAHCSRQTAVETAMLDFCDDQQGTVSVDWILKGQRAHPTDVQVDSKLGAHRVGVLRKIEPFCVFGTLLCVFCVFCSHAEIYSSQEL